MAKYFGTDGIRGVANEQLTCSIAFKIGEYLGAYYQDKNAKILIGSDTRISKDMLEASLCAGITSKGSDVHLLKVCPTPCVSFVVSRYDYDCAIMISASHNPYYDNGIKIFNNKGEKIDALLEEQIESYIDNEITIKQSNSESVGQVKDVTNLIKEYTNYLKTTLNNDLSNIKVALDCANGSASYIAKSLFEELGMKVSVINNNPDGYNINTNCGSTHLESLIEYVKNNEVDLGLAFDGDADRVLAVDKDGNVIDGDLIMYACAKNLIHHNKLKNDTIVTTIMSNIGLYLALDKIGVKYDKVAVGDKYVYESMSNNDYYLGGEQSGHVIFKEYATTGDGMLCGLQLIDAIIDSKTSLDKLVKEVVIYPQLLKNIKVKDKDVVLNSKLLQDRINEIEKALENEGRVLLRASGTEPLIRVMVEAKSDELCLKYVDELIDVINQL